MRPDLTIEATYRSYRKIDPGEAEEAVAERLGVDADRVAVVDVRTETSLIEDGFGKVKGYQSIYEFILEVAV